MNTQPLSPTWIVAAILALIFGAEEALVFALDYFLPPGLSQHVKALINAAALTLIMAPFVWWLVARRAPPAIRDTGLANPVASTAAGAIVTPDQRGSSGSGHPAAVTSGSDARTTAGGIGAPPVSDPHSAEYRLPVDADQRKIAEARIRRLTRNDSVAGIADRENFYACLGEDIAAAQRDHKELPLIYLSIAKFKAAHPGLRYAGDQLVATAGERVRYQARRSDMVAHMGGDEFAVIMSSGASRRIAIEASERIISALHKPYYLDGKANAVQIEVNIGIAIFPDDAQDGNGLVKAAYAEMQKTRTT